MNHELNYRALKPVKSLDCRIRPPLPVSTILSSRHAAFRGGAQGSKDDPAGFDERSA